MKNGKHENQQATASYTRRPHRPRRLMSLALGLPVVTAL